MRVCGPATPGFLTTLAATVLLAVVSFSVPHFKSIYFLRAAISQSGVGGSVTFGVLGYCLDFNGQTNCSAPRIGWEFNPNELLGNDLPIQIPNVVVKWLTYALVLHIVALGLAGVSAIFGLLAHVREMTMTCFSSCVSGMAAAVALVAFIFDLVLFFAARARINSVQGGSASIGNALWMTLAAWALLFFSGCVFAFGRCCVSKGPSGRRSKRRDSEEHAGGSKFDQESERMRLDAVKAEADRKRQKAEQREVGLPAFYEYERTPLRREEPAQYYEEEVEVEAPYSDRPRRDGSTRTVGGAGGSGAYQPGAPGTRTVDQYYNGTAPVAAAANTYPPRPQSQPQRQPSQGSQRTQRSQNIQTPPQRFQSPPAVPPLPATFVDPYSSRQVDPYLAVATAGAGAGAAYGHQGDSSYGNASHQQYPSGQQYPQLGHQQYPSTGQEYPSPAHQQYPSAGYEQYPSSGQQYPSSPPQQDPYATSSYNPNVATMSHPQPMHYQAQSQAYGQQEYGQQGGYDTQQEYNYAAQQTYAQPEPQRAIPVGYDPYTQRQPSYDQQGYDAYGQQHYGQQLQDPYQPREPARQPTMPQQLFDEPRPIVASPSPIASPPDVNLNTAAIAHAGPSSHAWSEEGTSEAPPQYEPMAGAPGVSTATRYPVEKR